MPSSILLTLALLPIWALSPLGSQASFRAFHWEANRTETATIFPYLSMNNSENIDGRRNAVASHSLLLGALGGSSRCIDSPVDLWGNVKIPSIEALMKVGRRSDQDGWYDLNSLAGGNITSREYASLIGIPTKRTQALYQSSRFSLETSYWTLQCLPIVNLHVSGARANSILLEHIPDIATMKNYSLSGPLWVYTDREGTIFSHLNSSRLEARRIVVQIGDVRDIAADCLIQTTYVETEVHCRKATCAASRVRRSVNKPWYPSRNYTTLDEDRGYEYFHSLVQADPVGGEESQTVLSSHLARMLGITDYIFHVETFFEFDGETELISAARSNPPGFAFALAQLLNTHWVAAIGPRYVLNPNGANYSDGLLGESWKMFGFGFINFVNATASMWSEDEVFTCSIPWLVTLFVAALFPAIACVANLVLGTQIVKGPYLSMNFSTLTRNNPFFSTPSAGSAMSDFDRGKLLRNVRVMYGDFADREAVGYLTIGMVEEQGRSTGVSRFGKDGKRVYD